MFKADILYHMISTINKKMNYISQSLNKILTLLEFNSNSYTCEICGGESYEVDKSFKNNGHMYRYAHCKKCNTHVKQEIVNKYITKKGRKENENISN